MNRGARQDCRFDGYGTWMRAAGLSPATVRARLMVARQVAELDGDGLTAWLATDDWSAQTRAAYAQHARAWHRWLTSRGLEAADPTVGLPRPRRPPGLPRPMPEDVFHAAVRHAGPVLRRILLLGGYEGLRRSEIVAVHARDVGPMCLRVSGKGGRSRAVPLHPLVREDLADADGWVLPGRGGGHLSANHAAHLVREATGWPCHSLRHRAATRWYAAGHDLLAVQRLLGHASVATTQVYTLVDPDDLAATVEAVA